MLKLSIVSNHTLRNNGKKRSLSFNCMPPLSLSSFLSIQCNGFFSLFSCFCSLFFFSLSFSVSRISSFLSHNNFLVHPLMLLLHPRTCRSPLLWFPPLPISCCCECHLQKHVHVLYSSSPGYEHCLTHRAASLTSFLCYPSLL